MLAIANVAEVSQVLDRGSGLELAGVSELLFDAPKRSAVARRIEECFLQPSDCPIDGALAPTRDAGEGILGSGTKSGTSRRR